LLREIELRKSMTQWHGYLDLFDRYWDVVGEPEALDSKDRDPPQKLASRIGRHGLLEGEDFGRGLLALGQHLFREPDQTG